MRPAEGSAVSDPAEAANSVSPSSPAVSPSCTLLSAIREANVAKATPASAKTTKTAFLAWTARAVARVVSGAADWVTAALSGRFWAGSNRFGRIDSIVCRP